MSASFLASSRAAASSGDHLRDAAASEIFPMAALSRALSSLRAANVFA